MFGMTVCGWDDTSVPVGGCGSVCGWGDSSVNESDVGSVQVGPRGGFVGVWSN